MRIFLLTLFYLLLSQYQTYSPGPGPSTFGDIVIPPNLLNVTCDINETNSLTCIVISNKNAGFQFNNPDYNIEFSGVLADVRDVQPSCQIYIIAASITFEYSNITGCDIYLYGVEVIKIISSNISVEGSIYAGLGSPPSVAQALLSGNYYAGSGGLCNQAYSYTSYGEFNTPYDENCTVLSGSPITCLTAGSGGYFNKTEGKSSGKY